jgi:hypothetical protein
MKLKQKIWINGLNFGNYNLKKDGITASMLQSYLNCRQRFLIDINRYSSIDQKVFFYGSLFHNMTELIYSNNGDVKISIVVNQCIDDMRKENKLIGIKEEEIEKFKGIATILGEAYLKHYKKDFRQDYQFFPEEEFDIKFNEYRLKGKIDLRYTKFNKIGLMEHKNYAQISEDIMPDLLSFNFQVLFYILATSLTYNIVTIEFFYNINRTPMYKQSDKESLKDFLNRFASEVKKKPEHFFKRYPLIFTKEKIELFKKELLIILKEVDNLIYTNKVINESIYRNQTACEYRKYRCSYLESCANGFLINCQQKKRLFMELSK